MAIKISRMLHAGYVFECDGTQIAFDPVLENPLSINCYAFPDAHFDYEQIRSLQFSAVFISHYHDDHCSLESLNLLDRKTPIYIFCLYEKLPALIRQLGFENVHQLELGRAITVGPIEVRPLRALDADVDSIFHVKADGLNVLNVVDSWIDHAMMDELDKLAPWDLVMWPFQTMRELEVLAPTQAPPASRELPPEWIAQLKRLKPKYLVPSSCQFRMESWSWYNKAFFPITYQQFNKEIAAALPATRIVRMNPSVSISIERDKLEMSSPLPWIRPIGEQDVDYAFDENIKAPPTAEIARHFPALAAEKAARVLRFCSEDIIERYRSLERSDEGYFDRLRRWRLSVYDHTGAPRHFSYALQNGEMKALPADELPPEWTTDVSIFKLYAALEEGESLTSMYLRINDFAFEPEVARDIQSADTLEDPLIRCLFDGAFAEYQKAQLRRIQRTRMIPQSNYKRMPWKNGQGYTDEIEISPAGARFPTDAFLWRLSCASVTAPNSFSQFPGYDRLLAILKGDGLTFGDIRLESGECIRFPGERKIDCALIQGPVIDLGLIFDREKIDAEMRFERLQRGRYSFALQAGTQFVVCVRGSILCGTVQAKEGDTIKVEDLSLITLGCSDPAEIYLISIKAKTAPE